MKSIKECRLLKDTEYLKKCQMTFCNRRDCEHNENDECQIVREYLKGKERDENKTKDHRTLRQNK